MISLPKMVNVLRESKSCNVENIGKVSNTCAFHSVASISTLLFRQHGHFRISKKNVRYMLKKWQ